MGIGFNSSIQPAARAIALVHRYYLPIQDVIEMSGDNLMTYSLDVKILP
jgi:hypothetical protein